MRLKAINIDTGLAAVEQLWCDEYDATLHQSVTLPVTNLAAEADFSESEVALKT
ncbi:hypothetical protein [Xenorhabdus szentirmaii]|nr:hypothetical protein [Xenorhabdus szentirmaii]